MSTTPSYNPYERPTPYEVLGLSAGPRATLKDIARAYNDHKLKAKTIPDLEERIKRNEALDRAKERLLRPDDRVLLDFFLLDGELFAELCREAACPVDDTALPVDAVMAPLNGGRSADELVPEDLTSLTEKLPVLAPPRFLDQPEGAMRLSLLDPES